MILPTSQVGEKESHSICIPFSEEAKNEKRTYHAPQAWITDKGQNKNRIIKVAESGKLIVKNKNTANDQLTRVGIQPSERDKIINLARNIVAQNAGGVNNNSSVPESRSVAIPFSEEA